jgi:hypothetical protein
MEKLINSLEPRTIMLVMFSSVLLISAALFSYVIWPEIKDYRDSVKTRTVLERVNESNVTLDVELASLSSEVASLQKQLLGDTASLPENQLEAFIIGRLQGISWRNNIQLLGVKPGKGGKVHIFQEMLFDIEISGDYFDLFNWLQEMGIELGFVVVKHFSIRPLDQKDTSPRLTAKLTIVSYREESDV